MNEEIKECMNVDIYECMNEEIYECMNEEINECMNEEINECMNEEINECMKEEINECMNEEIYECIPGVFYMQCTDKDLPPHSSSALQLADQTKSKNKVRFVERQIGNLYYLWTDQKHIYVALVTKTNYIVI